MAFQDVMTQALPWLANLFSILIPFGYLIGAFWASDRRSSSIATIGSGCIMLALSSMFRNPFAETLAPLVILAGLFHLVLSFISKGAGSVAAGSSSSSPASARQARQAAQQDLDQAPVDTGEAYGVVTDGTNPIKDAEIVEPNSGQLLAKSKPDGSFNFRAPAGKIYFIVRADGFEPWTSTGNWIFGRSISGGTNWVKIKAGKLTKINEIKMTPKAHSAPKGPKKVTVPGQGAVLGGTVRRGTPFNVVFNAPSGKFHDYMSGTVDIGVNNQPYLNDQPIRLFNPKLSNGDKRITIRVNIPSYNGRNWALGSLWGNPSIGATVSVALTVEVK